MKQSSGVSRFTEYRSPCLKNEEVKKSINTENPYVYRMYLQKNAKCLMSQNYAQAFQKNKLECDCKQCYNTCKTCGKQNVILNPSKKQ